MKCGGNGHKRIVLTAFLDKKRIKKNLSKIAITEFESDITILKSVLDVSKQNARNWTEI